MSDACAVGRAAEEIDEKTNERVEAANASDSLEEEAEEIGAKSDERVDAANASDSLEEEAERLTKRPTKESGPRRHQIR